MPKWISIDEAAHKYGVKEEDICLEPSEIYIPAQESSHNRIYPHTRTTLYQSV